MGLKSACGSTATACGQTSPAPAGTQSWWSHSARSTSHGCWTRSPPPRRTAPPRSHTACEQVPADFGHTPGEKMVILVTDGKEECGGSPSAVVADLLAKGFQLRLNIVGFALADEATKQEMAKVAQLTGGQFFDARDGKACALRSSRPWPCRTTCWTRRARKSLSGLTGGAASRTPRRDLLGRRPRGRPTHHGPQRACQRGRHDSGGTEEGRAGSRNQRVRAMTWRAGEICLSRRVLETGSGVGRQNHDGRRTHSRAGAAERDRLRRDMGRLGPSRRNRRMARHPGLRGLSRSHPDLRRLQMATGSS